MKFRTMMAGGAVALAGCAGMHMGSGGGWTTLHDGKSFDAWNRVGDANWRLEDGVAVADRGRGFLVTKQQYQDFEMHVEFWADADANSGIYIRVMNQKVVNTKAAYEVQIWDKSPAMATASVMPPAKASDKFKAANKWSTFEITAKGPRIINKMDGEVAVDVNDTTFTSGPIALQYNSGTIKFRKVMVRRL